MLRSIDQCVELVKSVNYSADGYYVKLNMVMIIKVL